MYYCPLESEDKSISYLKNNYFQQNSVRTFRFITHFPVFSVVSGKTTENVQEQLILITKWDLIFRQERPTWFAVYTRKTVPKILNMIIKKQEISVRSALNLKLGYSYKFNPESFNAFIRIYYVLRTVFVCQISTRLRKYRSMFK